MEDFILPCNNISKIIKAEPEQLLEQQSISNARYAIERCELHIDGYELFENLEERGRGVCIYIHRSLKPRRSSLNDITKYEECIWLDISLDGKNRLLLGCIYTEAQIVTEITTSSLKER